MSQLFGFPSGLSGGSKETSYLTNWNTSHSTNATTNYTTSWGTSYSTSWTQSGWNSIAEKYNGGGMFGYAVLGLVPSSMGVNASSRYNSAAVWVSGNWYQLDPNLALNQYQTNPTYSSNYDCITAMINRTQNTFQLYNLSTDFRVANQFATEQNQTLSGCADLLANSGATDLYSLRSWSGINNATAYVAFRMSVYGSSTYSRSTSRTTSRGTSKTTSKTTTYSTGQTTSHITYG